ncbi:MAG TPA: HEAT repeat domain-containing protein [Gemmataceae bacterium]|jgi:HEAT repeat protein
MRRFLLGWIVCLLLPAGIQFVVASSQADEPASKPANFSKDPVRDWFDSSHTDESTLKAAGIPTDGPGLVAYFKQRTITVSNAERIKQLVRQLGDDDFKAREEASRHLMMLGPRARPFLQAALRDSDPEIVRRAQDCLERISRGMSVTALAAGVRMLARLKPNDTAAVLLNYLPSAEDERVTETLHQVLPFLAVRDGKAEPAFLEALKDASADKRAAAAVALAGSPLPDVKPIVGKLLHDRDQNVRMRVGLALVAQGDKEAMPVLIRSINEVPLERNGLVFELLDRLARGAPPKEMPVADQKANHKYFQAWDAWWKDHQDTISPSRLEQASRALGFTLIALLDDHTVEYLDRAKDVRWKITDAHKPLDVQLLPGEERVLIAEYNANRVSERNLKGEIVWQMPVNGPLVAQRLPNGNTFIAMVNQLIEVDKDGKEVFTYSRPDGGEFMRATKLRDGGIACVVKLGVALSRYVRLEPSGKDFKEVKSWGVQVRTSGGRIEVLPNGHVLIPEMDNNRVIEYDADGHPSGWEVALDQPIAAVRLPNGNTLVTLMRENRAVEVDRAGKEVWQFKADSKVTRAYRR